MINTPKIKFRKILTSQSHNLLALSFFVIVTIIVSWPILTQLNSVIIGIDNDVYINPWADWWTQKALQSADTILWETDFLFFPQGANLTYHSFSHLNTLLSLMLQTVFKPLPAYNLTILINYVLTGFAMYQLVRYLTNSFSAGIVGGIVFAFSSHNLYQSSHPVLVSIWCFPWITLYLMKAVQERQLKWAVIAGLFVFLGAFTSSVLLILIVFWVAILFAFMWFSKDWNRPSWTTIIVFGAVSTLLTIPLIVPLLYDAIIGENSSFLMEPRDALTTDIISPFVPHWFFWFKRGIYLGIVPTILAISALIKCRQKTWLWLSLLIISFLMSIGPTPQILDIKIDIILPWSALVAPVIRNTYRFNILFSFGFSVLVALGWGVLYKQFSEKKPLRYIWVTATICLILIDYLLPLMPFTPIEVSPFYTDILLHEPDNISVAMLPNGRQEGKRYLFYQIYHQHPITGGVVSRADLDIKDYIYNNPILTAGEISDTPATLPQDMERPLQNLANDNIKYLIIDKTLMDDLEKWRDAIPRLPFYEDQLILVYLTDKDS